MPSRRSSGLIKHHGGRLIFGPLGSEKKRLIRKLFFHRSLISMPMRNGSKGRVFPGGIFPPESLSAA